MICKFWKKNFLLLVRTYVQDVMISYIDRLIQFCIFVYASLPTDSFHLNIVNFCQYLLILRLICTSAASQLLVHVSYWPTGYATFHCTHTNCMCAFGVFYSFWLTVSFMWLRYCNSSVCYDVGSTEGAASTYQVKQLEQQCERMKDALVK